MQTPLVSIIIPTYNRADLISETLDSVIAQTYTNWECIVVDDGSTDDTNTLLEGYCERDIRFHYHVRPFDRQKGANACRNYGFELSKGEYINWFDDDDVMLSDFLKVKIDAYTKELSLVICSGYYTDVTLKDRKVIDLDEKSKIFRDYVLWKLQILTPSILFKKSFLLGKELFLNKISRGQETELFSRLFFQLEIDEYRIINKPLFLYRQHTKTKSVKSIQYVKSYNESRSYIAIENLKKSIKIQDLELINYCYIYLINLFFRGLENSHLSNSSYILKHSVWILKKKKEINILEFLFYGILFLIISRGSYRIEKKWKLITIKS